MTRIWDLLKDGCWHTYETVHSGNYEHKGSFSDRTGFFYVLNCKKCGRHKMEKMI